MILKPVYTTLAVILLCSLYSEGLAETISIPIALNKAHQYSIQARINNSDPMWCVVDSGGGGLIYLDQGRAAEMGILPTLTGQSAGPGDAEMKQDSRSQASLEVSGLNLGDRTVLLSSRPQDSCVIGQTVFRQYIVEVDYESSVMRLHDPQKFSYDGPGKIVPFVLEGGTPFVSASLTTPNGKSFKSKMAVDTGCGSGLAMFGKTYIDKNDLMNQGLSPALKPYFGTSGRLLPASAEKLSVGPFDITHPTVLLQQAQGFGGAGGPDGLLCGDFLHRFKLIFNYESRTVILEPNALYWN
jgi:hypothetical protein